MTEMWKVLLLFTIPIGGGIPAGVVLAQKYGFEWYFTSFLYFLSDVLLAIAFEPLMLLFIKKSETVPAMTKLREAMAKSTKMTVDRLGIRPGPLSLIAITFGIDPMTGRAVSKSIGHGFFFGWTLVIIGDMFYFWVIIASTLWLNHILGDGTWTVIIITVALFVIPSLFKRNATAK